MNYVENKVEHKLLGQKQKNVSRTSKVLGGQKDVFGYVSCLYHFYVTIRILEI